MRVHPSAYQHGIGSDDIRHAVRNAFRIVHGDGFEMLIGADTRGRFIEVGVRTDDDGETVVFHAMPARSKFLR